MTKIQLLPFLATLVLFGIPADAHAQAINPNTGAPIGVGGTASSGTGVPTGQGALPQPVPPASSSIYNSRQNLQGGTQRPQGTPGPVQTNPAQNPFGR